APPPRTWLAAAPPARRARPAAAVRSGGSYTASGASAPNRGLQPRLPTAGTVSSAAPAAPHPALPARHSRKRSAGTASAFQSGAWRGRSSFAPPVLDQTYIIHISLSNPDTDQAPARQCHYHDDGMPDSPARRGCAMSQTLQFDPDLLRKNDVRGHRYTSYPTAPQFSPEFDETAYRELAERVGAEPAPLSLYVHIPFCRTVCFYCGCNKVITANYRRAEDYLG